MLTEQQQTLLDLMIGKKDCWGKYLHVWRPDIRAELDKIEWASHTSEKACHFIFGSTPPLCPNCSKPTPFIKFDTKNRLPTYREYCDKKCCDIHQRATRNANLIKRLSNHGDFSLITHPQKSCADRVRVVNNRCGHEFDVIFRNLFKNSNYCPTCGGKERALKATKSIVEACDERDAILSEKHGIDKATYIRLVRRETTKTYKDFKECINPLGLKIARAGESDAFHVDHIVPIVAAYELDVPIHPKVLGSLINLQMMNGSENISKGKTLDASGHELLQDLQRISRVVEGLQPNEVRRLKILNRTYGSLDGVKIEFA
jgi:hypothetical protein